MEIGDNPNKNAKFTCSIAIANEKGEVEHLTEGICQGKINSIAKGNNGFGYDPIFVPKGFENTFAEIPNELKNKISHRGKALEKIFEILRLLT
jgi:XTP/dITP diphosphohydrolase